MSRRIQTAQYQAAGGGTAPDGYFDKIVKYIPSDIVAAWVAIGALVKGASGIAGDTVMWVLFAVFVVITVWWMWLQTRALGKPAAVWQIVIATAAFVVWVFALGAPFNSFGWYHSVYASIALIVFTLVIGKIDPPQ